MKVLALNSSPRAGGQSKTELLLTHFVSGMKRAGADVEVVNLRQKKISFCTGCYTCWTKTPGVCVHRDEMALELFPKWRESDLAVYASPLYHFLVNAQMKAFIERTLPSLMPYLKPNGETTTHPLRGKRPESVLISVAGFPEMSNFDQLSFWAKKVFGKGLLAEIYRPAAEALTNSWKLEDILNAMEQAGEDIINSKGVAAPTLALIEQPLTDPATMAATANLMWQALIDRKMTPAEAAHNGHIAPRPGSIETFMAMLNFAFNPVKAADKNGTLQFNFNGSGAGSCFFVMDKGKCAAFLGRADAPDCTIESPFEVWADIIEGKTDGGQALMDGKYKANGDISLLMVWK
jgi:multimeric flavodoxin WrbA